jgi:hypothetical protein
MPTQEITTKDGIYKKRLQTKGEKHREIESFFS